MGMSGATNGCGAGEYIRIPEDVEAGLGKEAGKGAGEGECPAVLRWRAIRWWAQVAALGILLAGAAAAAVVFLGPLVNKTVRASLPFPPSPLPPSFLPLLVGERFLAD